MASKAKSPTFTHKETRLNLDSAIPGTTLNIRLPTHPGTSSLLRNSSKQRHHWIADPTPAEDENTFKQRYLATFSSIYHRKYHSSPRSFLWRILENNKVLTVRAVDICKKGNEQDRNVTLRFHFPNEFREKCVAFAESEGHDVLLVYVLTTGGQLYVLMLRPEYFRRVQSTEGDVKEWCRSFVSNGLTFNKVHRLVALKDGDLLAALSDGGLLRLQKAYSDDDWKERQYNERNLLSSFSFRNTNSYRADNINFDRTSAVSITSEPMIIAGSPYIFTVCMDHQLRVWNLGTGKLAYSGDIITQSKLASDLTRYTIDPNASQLVKIFNDSQGNTVVVTFSPMGLGQFKFWAVENTRDGFLTITDKFPDNVFELRAPSSDQWTVLDFSVVVGSDPDTADLWVLWKNNLSLRAHRVNLNLHDLSTQLRDTWKNKWAAMTTETLEDCPLPVILSSDPSDSTDKWLDFILFPGKFSSATIETALNIYENSLGRSKDASNKRSKQIAERMCTLVASTSSLTSFGASPNYDQFRLATDNQWRRFYRLLVELEKSRGEALSLSIDSELGLPWITTADGVSIIRTCSSLEDIWHNSDAPREMAHQKQVCALVNAAAVFRDGCSDTLVHNCNTILKAELGEEPLTTDYTRLRTFYEKTNFAGQIGDEEYSQLLTNLGGTFNIMNNKVYESLVSNMKDLAFPNQQESHPLTEFGKKAIVKGMQETIELHRTVCFDQLMLLVFFENEVDQKEEDTRLDTAKVFNSLISLLSRIELLRWLAKTQITIRQRPKEKSSPPKRLSDGESQTITVLEGCAFHLLGFDITNPLHNMSSMITDLLMQMCDESSVYELEPYLIQCFLLKNHRTDLALEFNRFCNRDPFSTYIQGRTYLAANDLETAAMCFKRAAFGLSFTGIHGGGRCSTNSLLDDTEWNLLYSGMPNYYAHIVSLFDDKKHFSHVLTFANLSLQFNPFPSTTDLSILRTEMLSRLFNAQLQLSHFSSAHTTLSLLPPHSPLQLSSLRTLIHKICESSASSLLINTLPFLSLQDSVDDILHEKCASVPDVDVGVQWHRILYAWRIKRGDFKGAAAILLERLQRVKGGRGRDERGMGVMGGKGETGVTGGYLGVVNCLSCVGVKEQWILDEGPVGGSIHNIASNGSSGSGGGNEKEGKRKVVTLTELREELGREMDRLAAIENDQFEIMDVDMEEEEDEIGLE